MSIPDTPSDFINSRLGPELSVNWSLTKPGFSKEGERFYVSEPIPETELDKYEGILKDAFGLEVHSSTEKTSPLVSPGGSSSITTVRVILSQKAVDTLRSQSERDSKESGLPGFAAQSAQGIRRALGPPPAPAGLPAGERDLKQREEAPPPYSGPLAAGRKAPPPPYSAAVSSTSVEPKEKPPMYQERDFKVRHEGDIKNEGDVKVSAAAAASPQEIAHASEAESLFKEIGASHLLEASGKIINFIVRDVVPQKISGEGLQRDLEYKILNVRPGPGNTFILVMCPRNLLSRAVEQNRTTEARLERHEIRKFIDNYREDLPRDLFPEPSAEALPPDLFPAPSAEAEIRVRREGEVKASAVPGGISPVPKRVSHEEMATHYFKQMEGMNRHKASQDIASLVQALTEENLVTGPNPKRSLSYNILNVIPGSKDNFIIMIRPINAVVPADYDQISLIQISELQLNQFIFGKLPR